MNNQLRLGLIVEGNATGSAVLRLKNLGNELGPVKSTGLQVARRFSNFLRAGYAVAHYQELQAAKLVLLRVPDTALTRVIAELCATELRFEELSFVLCETWVLTGALRPLQERGAAIASLVRAPNRLENESCFVVEGELSLVRQMRRVLERGGARALELRPGTKSRYFAAKLLMTALPIPIFQAAQQALRDCGISGNELEVLMEEMAQDLFGAFLKGGRAEWGGPLTECLPETATQHFRELAKQDAELSGIVQQWLEWGRKRMMKRAKGQSA